MDRVSRRVSSAKLRNHEYSLLTARVSCVATDEMKTPIALRLGSWHISASDYLRYDADQHQVLRYSKVVDKLREAMNMTYPELRWFDTVLGF